MIRPFTLVNKTDSESYTLTFDEYDTLDTVRRVRDGKYMSTSSAVVKKILNNIEFISVGILPHRSGLSWTDK